MTAFGSELPHYVTVTARQDTDGNQTDPDVTFECPWLYGKCHFIPGCDHETFDSDHYADYGPGHEAEHHLNCWMADFFDNGAHQYAGDDADDMTDQSVPAGMNRTGAINTFFGGEYVEWTFKETNR